MLQYPVSVKGDDVVVLGGGGSEPTYAEAPEAWGSAYGSKYSNLLDEFDPAAAEDSGYPDIDDSVIVPMDGSGSGSYSEEGEYDLDLSWEEGVKNAEEVDEPIDGDGYIAL